jgi:PAS domain-containing protein
LFIVWNSDIRDFPTGSSAGADSNSRTPRKGLVPHRGNPFCDLDCRTAFVNPAFTAVFGYQREDVLGRHIPFVPSWDVEKSEAELSELLSGKRVPARETRRLSSSGEEIDIAVSVSLLP